MFEDPIAFALTLPPAVVLVTVFFSALLEYVVPPFPGDSLVLIGFVLAGQGAASPLALFIVALVGSVTGAAIAFLLGDRYGLAILRRLTTRKARHKATDRLHDVLERHGEPVLIVNRFVPVLRGFLLYGAGATHFRIGRSLIWTTVSSALFNGFLLTFGWLASGSWEQIRASYKLLNRGIGLSVAVVLTIWLLLLYRRRRS